MFDSSLEVSFEHAIVQDVVLYVLAFLGFPYAFPLIPVNAIFYLKKTSYVKNTFTQGNSNFQ